MPSDVYEDPLELEVEILEAGPPTADSYPYPHLRQTGSRTKRTFRSLVLENAYLRAAVVPTLGGRIVSLLDKRTGVEVLPPPVVVPGGRRGARMIGGIELHLDGRERLTSLGAVQFAAEEGDEDRPASLWLGESVTGEGTSWHCHLSLPHERAELLLESRIFNRFEAPVPYNGGLMLPAQTDVRANGSLCLATSKGVGVVFATALEGWHCGHSDGRVTLTRFQTCRTLAPRQLDTWRAAIVPVSGLEQVHAASGSGALAVLSNKVQIQVTERLPSGKVVILTNEGQTLEAPVQAYPEQVLELALPEGAAAVALMDVSRRVLIRWDSNWRPADAETPPVLRLEASEPLDPVIAAFEVGTRHFAYAKLGMEAMSSGEWSEAESYLEQALLYNGEDHLSWWFKALSKRLSGEEAEESPELLNAHYLAPLEPALRAESFLAQPKTMELEANPVLKPFSEHPESFVEVACLLIEAGLFEQASYWLDESLRHEDLPMLRYLLAYCHLRVTKLNVEIAKELAAAGAKPLGPPYPWRSIELAALRALAASHPSDSRLRELTALADQRQ